ncbi:hypothetical protein C8J56DRAFT_1049078 [Mycena floridula]|nr:hypothetical protein C8J56DRAFT_1049078 [Mycena floridula]
MSTTQSDDHHIQKVKEQVFPALAALLKVKKVVTDISTSLPEIEDEDLDMDTDQKKLAHNKMVKRRLRWAVHLDLQDALPALGDKLCKYLKDKYIITSMLQTGTFLAEYLDCQCCGATDHITCACDKQYVKVGSEQCQALSNRSTKKEQRKRLLPEHQARAEDRLQPKDMLVAPNSPEEEVEEMDVDVVAEAVENS